MANELGLGEHVEEPKRLLEKTPNGFKMSKPNATPTEFDPKGIKTENMCARRPFADIVSSGPERPGQAQDRHLFSHREEGSAKAHRLKQHTLTFENEREAEDFADGLRAVVRLHNRGELGGHSADPLDEKEALLAKLEDETDFEHHGRDGPEPVVGGLLPAALVERGAWLCPG